MTQPDLDLALYESTALLARALGGRGSLADVLESIYAGEPAVAWEILRAYLDEISMDDPVREVLLERIAAAGKMMDLEAS